MVIICYLHVNLCGLAVNIFPHTDCFTVFVVKFGVGNKAVFLVKNQHPLVMFYVSVNSEEPGSAVIIITLRAFHMAAPTIKEPIPLYISENG
jgi:hypothetical protein